MGIDIFFFTSPMSITKEQISAVMSVETTNPLVAYYMLRDQVPYPTAVDHYQKHNEKLKYMKFAGKDPLEQTVQKYMFTTDLTRDEVHLLLTVPYHCDFDIPTDAEARAMYPDSHFPIARFMYGCTEEDAEKIFEYDHADERIITQASPEVQAITFHPSPFPSWWHAFSRKLQQSTPPQ